MDYRSVSSVVAARVRALREARGWTQDDAAARLRAAGLPWGQSALSRFEKGGREPTVSELILLASAFGVAPADLLSGATGETLLGEATVPPKALPGLLSGQGMDKIKPIKWTEVHGPKGQRA